MNYVNTVGNILQIINSAFNYSLLGCGVASLKNIDSSTPMKVGAVYGMTVTLIHKTIPSIKDINFKVLAIFSVEIAAIVACRILNILGNKEIALMTGIAVVKNHHLLQQLYMHHFPDNANSQTNP